MKRYVLHEDDGEINAFPLDSLVIVEVDDEDEDTFVDLAGASDDACWEFARTVRLDKPQVYVSVSGGIAEAQVIGMPESAEIILIDWDECEDNTPSLDWILATIEQIKAINDETYRNAVFLTLEYELMKYNRMGDYYPQEAEQIRTALRAAGHPLPENVERQEVLPLR